MKGIIAQVAQRNHVPFKVARETIEANLKKDIVKRDDRGFATEFIIEQCGDFKAYVEVTVYGDHMDWHGKTVERKIIGYPEMESEITYGGIQIFFLEEGMAEKYAEEICKLFKFMCERYGFFDHLDLITVQQNGQSQEIQILCNLFDCGVVA